MKRSFPVALMLAGAMTIGACSRDADKKPVASDTPSGASTSPPAAAANARDNALVRVVDAIPDPAIDVVAEQTAIATTVTYPTVTPYKEVPASADDFAIKIAGQPDSPVLAENSEAIMSGRHYSLVAFPGKDGDRAAVKVIMDDIATPADGKARVRVINATPDTEQVDVVAKRGEETLFDDIDFREASGYKEVDPAIGMIEVRDKDGKRVLATPTVTLEAGRNYTIVVTGKAEGSPRLRAQVIEDRVVGQADTN